MIENEEELSPENLKRLEKQRLKEEKERQAQKDEEERKYNLRKDLMTTELNYYESVKDQIKETTDFTAGILKGPMITTEKEHFWGCFKLEGEWKDFHCHQLFEDLKGRVVGEDFMNHVYLESFDQIMGSYQEIILQMMNDFEFRRDRMLKNHWAFLKYAKLKGMQVRDDVRAVSYGISDRYERKCQVIDRRQRKHRKRSHNKHLEKLAETSYDLETKAFNLWVQFRTVFGRFRKDWKNARRLIFFLKLKDAEDRKEIIKQKKILDEINRTKTEDLVTEQKSLQLELCKDLTEERNQYSNAFGLLQNKLKENMKFDEGQATHLTKVSLGVIKELERYKEKVEKVLQIKQLCLKLETQEEKVVFPSETVKMHKPIIIKEFNSAFCLDKLTNRIALVKSHCDHMNNKLHQVAQTNSNLKNRIRYVLSELRPNRDVDLAMKHY